MSTASLKITILIHDVLDVGLSAEEALARSVARDVLAWIHSDDSGLAGDGDTHVQVELINPALPLSGRCYRKNYSDSGEAVEEVL